MERVALLSRRAIRTMSNSSQMLVGRALADGERARVQFAVLQLFALIFLQKFAVGPQTFPLSVPMLLMFVSIGWMLACGTITVSPVRLLWYACFVVALSLSQIFSGGSISSIAELILLYGCMTVIVALSEEAYRRVLNCFVLLMILPAVIITFQYGYQKLTGLGNPLSMDDLLPRSILLQGFIYDAHYPWYSTFQRPNGFFFLEPSFASLFAAAAAIVELTYFKRPWLASLMLAATIMSMGGTGLTMLVIAVPLLVARQSTRVITAAFVTAALGLFVVVLNHDGWASSGEGLTFLSRLNELGNRDSSGFGRLIQPAQELVKLISDWDYLFAGTGAGSITPDYGSSWPATKLAKEYGLLSMVAFLLFFASCVTGAFNMPLKAAMVIIFQLTGGYLLSPIMVEAVLLLCVIVVPAGALPTPLYGFIKQYVRDHLILRTEAASNNVNDYGVKKAVENLPVLQNSLSAINDTYLNVQQDILETFVDRGQLRKLAEPTVTSTGKRIPGLKLDHPRQLALMHALVRFAHIAAGNTFTTAEIRPAVIAALGFAPESYTLASLRYDLSKFRAKGLVAKLPNSRRYQLLPQGYSICLVFMKLFERVYAPLTAGLLSPIKADVRLDPQRRSQLDRLYQRVIDDLDTLVRAVGLKAA